MKRTAAGLWIPEHLKGGQKPIAVVFWHSEKLNRIVVGLPEQYPIPPILANLGFSKVVCRSAHDVEIWSQKLRDQERRDREMSDEERERFEGPLRAVLRQELVTKMLTSRNSLNRDFCKAALEAMDKAEAKNKETRTSFQHCEAYEDGK